MGGERRRGTITQKLNIELVRKQNINNKLDDVSNKMAAEQRFDYCGCGGKVTGDEYVLRLLGFLLSER